MFRYKTKPYEHQKVALESRMDKKTLDTSWRWGAASQRSCSTTSHGMPTTNLSTQQLSLRQSVYRNWEVSEILTHLPEDIQPEVYVWSANPNRVNVKDCRRVLINRTFRILLVNVEAFGASKRFFRLEHFVRDSTFLFAVDESTTIKNPKPSGLNLVKIVVQRTNAFLPIARYEIAYGFAVRIRVDKIAGIRQLLFVLRTLRYYKDSARGFQTFSRLYYRTELNLATMDRFSGLRKKKL